MEGFLEELEVVELSMSVMFEKFVSTKEALLHVTFGVALGAVVDLGITEVVWCQST